MAMNPTRDNTTSEEKAREKEIGGPDKFVNSSEMKSH